MSRFKLKGKKLIELYKQVYERDKGLCRCSKWVEWGVPPHHIAFKSKGGGDTIENLITLCPECHYRIHHQEGR